MKKWALVDADESIKLRTRLGLFSSGQEIEVVCFVNTGTGEIKMFAQRAVDYLGVDNVLKGLNDQEGVLFRNRKQRVR